MRGLRKPTSPPLPLREGPPLSPSPFPFRVQGMYQPPYWCFFLKSTRPSLPLKKAPPLFPSPFPLRGQGMCQPPYSVLKPLRYKVGGPSEVYASSGAAVFCAGWTAGIQCRMLDADCSQLAGIAVYGNAGIRCRMIMGTHCWVCCWWERRDRIMSSTIKH